MTVFDFVSREAKDERASLIATATVAGIANSLALVTVNVAGVIRSSRASSRSGRRAARNDDSLRAKRVTMHLAVRTAVRVTNWSNGEAPERRDVLVELG